MLVLFMFLLWVLIWAAQALIITLPRQVSPSHTLPVSYDTLPSIKTANDSTVTPCGSPDSFKNGTLLSLNITMDVANPPTVWDFTEGRFKVEVRALGKPDLKLAYVIRFWEYDCFDLYSRMQEDHANYDDAISKHRRRYDSRALGFPMIFESFMEQDPETRQSYTYAMERVTLYAMSRWTRSWTDGMTPAARIKLWSINGKYKEILADGYFKSLHASFDPSNVTIAN